MGEPKLKPHEETWYWHEAEKVIATGTRDDDADERGEETWRIIVETDSGYYPPRKGERELIAQAPMMARVLLELAEMLADPAGMTVTSIDEARAMIATTLIAAGVQKAART